MMMMIGGIVKKQRRTYFQLESSSGFMEHTDWTTEKPGGRMWIFTGRRQDSSLKCLWTRGVSELLAVFPGAQTLSQRFCK
jgi:hypothetical protein